MRQHRPLGPVLVFGEVLFDQFPDHRRLGGAPFNYAFHLHQMGIPVKFVSRVGSDDAGKEILEFARQNDFPTEGIQVDPDHPTGEVRVTLDSSGVPKFDILPERAFDYIVLNPHIESLWDQEIPFIYFGTLIQRHTVSAQTLKKILETFYSRSTLMSDLNLRAPFYNREVVEFSMNIGDLIKISDGELHEIKSLLQISASRNGLIQHLLEQFGLGFICITRGREGSELFVNGDPNRVRVPAIENVEVVDTVGAGDAYTAMLTAGYLASWPRQSMLEQATRFASRICGIPGALPEDKQFYQELRFR